MTLKVLAMWYYRCDSVQINFPKFPHCEHQARGAPDTRQNPKNWPLTTHECAKLGTHRQETKNWSSQVSLQPVWLVPAAFSSGFRGALEREQLIFLVGEGTLKRPQWAFTNEEQEEEGSVLKTALVEWSPVIRAAVKCSLCLTLIAR